MIYEELEQVFKDDCVDNLGYTKLEAEGLIKIHGALFLDKMIDDLWNNWSENFPVDEKEQ